MRLPHLVIDVSIHVIVMLLILTVFYQFVLLPQEITAYQKKSASILGSPLVKSPQSEAVKTSNQRVFINVYLIIITLAVCLGIFLCFYKESLVPFLVSLSSTTFPVFLVVFCVEYLMFKFVLLKYVPVPPSTIETAFIDGIEAAFVS